MNLHCSQIRRSISEKVMIFTLDLSQNKFAVHSCDKARFKESIFLTLNALAIGFKISSRFILPPQRGQKHNLKYRDKNSKSSTESESFRVMSQITESFSNRGHICYPNSDNSREVGKNRHNHRRI